MKQTLNIRKLRQSKGWTLQYVGDAVGLNKTAVYDIETGRRKPSYDVLVKLETLFKKKHDCLLAQAEETTQGNYNSSGQNGVAEAKELNEAAQDFMIDVETILDIGEDGRLDCPERRAKAERIRKALEAVLE